MATFTLLAPTTRTALLADLEGLWQRFDNLVGTLGPGDWSGKHGKHWTFADVPYHLAYFDLDVIATAIKRGLDVPANEQVMRTEAEQDAWNEIKFTQRPQETTPKMCLELMRIGRQAIRDAIAGLSEADLKRLVFIPLVGLGWVSVGVALETCYSHTWNHFMQLRFWMQCDTLSPNFQQTQRALSYFMAAFAQNMDQSQAAQLQLTVVMDFSGRGGGAWTLQVVNGICYISRGKAAKYDLFMSQSPETFVKTRTGILNPLLALLIGAVKVRGWKNLPTFVRLFPLKSLDFAPAAVGMLEMRTIAQAGMLVQASAA